MPIASVYRALFGVLLVLVTSVAAPAASLQFIVFAETLDPAIGTIQDLSRATAWARTIESYTGLELKLQTLSGSNLTPANARSMLQALSPAADDVVYFTYSGHGANPGNSQWPVFTFMFNSSDPYLTFDEVVSTLQPKPQRMLIVLADCCNVPLSMPERLIPAFEPSGQSALTTANFQRLFLNFRGTILATAAAVGQYSLGGATEGGLFLNTFMEDFRTLADTTPDLTWDTILTRTATDARDIAAYYVSTGALGNIEPQEAQFTINTEQVAAATPGSPGGTPTSSPTSTPTTASENNPSAAPACGAVGPLPLFCMMLGLCAMRAGRKVNELL